MIGRITITMTMMIMIIQMLIQDMTIILERMDNR